MIDYHDMKTKRTVAGRGLLAVVLAGLMGSLCLTACMSGSRTGVKVYDGFPETRRLTAEVMPLDTALFRYPYRIRVQNGRAAVLDLHGTDCFLHLFSYPDFAYLASGGRRGEGPEEMLSAENLRWDGAALWALDASKSQLSRWTLPDGANSLSVQAQVKLDEAVLRALDFVQYDDSTFIIPDYSGDSRLCRVNGRGELLGKWGQIPSSNQDALRNARPALAQGWRSFIDYNPRNGVLAAVTQLGEVLEVWNLRDSTHVVCMGPGGEPQFQVSQGYGIPTGIMGFGDVQVGDDAIYAVFQGQSFRDIAQAVQQGTSLPDGGRYLYVFSLQGEPLRSYVLDHYIHGLWVDEQEGLFIGTDVNSDQPIVRFRF